MSDKKYEIVKFIDNQFELDVYVNPNEETIWLTQNEIAELFDKDRKTITRHIQNIIKEFELNEKQVCSKKEHTAQDGKKYIVSIYNLDMIIAIGYRVMLNFLIDDVSYEFVNDENVLEKWKSGIIHLVEENLVNIF